MECNTKCKPKFHFVSIVYNREVISDIKVCLWSRRKIIVLTHIIRSMAHMFDLLVSIATPTAT